MKKTILIAAVMFFAFTVAASAQALYQVGSIPVTTVASCGTTELTGDIIFSKASNSPAAVPGTITINYGVPITNNPLLAPNNQIVVTGATLISTTADLAAGRLILSVTADNAVISVSGVRVNVAGNSALTSLSATITSTGNAFVTGQTNSVPVIYSIASAIASIDTNNGANPPVPTTININAVSTLPLPGNVTVNVTEGFLDAWKTVGQQLRFTPTAVPAGITVTFPASFTTTGGTTFTKTATSPTTIPAVGLVPFPTVSYAITAVGAAASTTLDVATFQLAIALENRTGFPAPASPLPQGSFSLTVDMGPRLGPAPDFPGSQVPQYTGTTCQRGPASIFTIVTANTNLLIPYAVYTGPTGYDTGIAIANTTKDPAGAAVPQDGVITFNFYPQTGDPFAYTTAATSPGSGLNAGVLQSGRMYAVLLSQLLTAAGKASSFTFSGYIIAVVNATNAHGQYFISDFASFTNGALMLVLDPSSTARRTAPEGLNN